MKVFISWSGDRSKKIAAYLHDWLPSVLQNIRPYMSAENIDKGQRWSLDIANQLQDTHYGIICVTPDNIEAPWILFESGALSKSMLQARVSPIIFGLSPSDLSKSPLLQFQLTQFTQEEMHKLIISINNTAPEGEQIFPDTLTRAFNRAWQELENTVAEMDLSSLDHERAPSDNGVSKGIDAKLLDSLEEILTNTRSQLKLLNSPAEILPPNYLSEVLKYSVEHNSGRDGFWSHSPSIPHDHKLWRSARSMMAEIFRAKRLAKNEPFWSLFEALILALDRIYFVLYDPAVGPYPTNNSRSFFSSALPSDEESHVLPIQGGGTSNQDQGSAGRGIAGGS
jgi:hypothetical protein